MKQSYHILFFLLFIVFFLSSGKAHASKHTESGSVSDTLSQKTGFLKSLYRYFEESNKVTKGKKFDISFIGGPSCSIDTKLGIGVVASGLYRLDSENTALPPSNVSIYTNLTTSGFFAIGIEGNTIFKNDDYRLIYDMGFSLMPSKYWGIGYSFGDQKDDFTLYKEYQLFVKADGLKKVAPNLYVGLTATVQNIVGKDFEYQKYIENQDPDNTAIGGGFIITYDSRDFIPNAFEGLYLKVEQNFFPRHLGSKHNFTRFNFSARYYQKIWKGGLVAFDFNTTLNSGNVPWSMLALVGGSNQMRGYFKGQYRDKKLINTQI